MAFLPQSKCGIKKRERELDPIPHPELEYLLGLAFLVSFTAPNNLQTIF